MMTPEHLDAIRTTARAITAYTTIHTEAVEPRRCMYAVAATDGREGEELGLADSLGQAETLRTLLSAVPALLDEVERLRQEHATLDGG